MSYAKGCQRDPAHRRTQLDARAHPRLGAHLSVGLPIAASLQAFEPSRLDQGQSGSCTAGSSTAATACAFAAAMHPLGWVPSQAAMYAATRAVDRAGAGGKLQPLTDGGAQLSDVVDAYAQWGICPMRGPSPDGRNYDVWTDADTGGFPAGNVNDEPNLVDLEAESLSVVVGTHRIDETAGDVSDQAAASIAAGFPVVVAFFCDSAFQAWRPGNPPVGVPNRRDPTGGGHAVWLSAYTTHADGSRVWRLVNSWGSWADNGTCLVSDAWLRATWDLYVWSVEKK